jgi:hypothetical protein
LVQPRAYSACASTVVSHVSIPTGSFDGSGGQRPRAPREPTDIRWTPVGGSLKVGSFGEQLWAGSGERHQLVVNRLRAAMTTPTSVTNTAQVAAVAEICSTVVAA